MKQNEADALRQKLDGLDARQVDKDFDPDALWSAIEQRLPAPQPRRTVSLPLYVWSAAACLLVGALLGFWILRSEITMPQPIAKQAAPVKVFTPKPTIESPLTPLPKPIPAIVSAPVSGKEIKRVRPVGKEIIIPKKPAENLPALVVEAPVLAKETPVAVLLSTTSKQPHPRAPYLVDVSPEEAPLVKSEAGVPSRRFPFFLSPYAIPSQTAFVPPASVFDGLRK